MAFELSAEQRRRQAQQQREVQFWTEVPADSQMPGDCSAQCAICLSEMRPQQGDEAAVQLALCSHIFHRQCIQAAFAVKRQCPLCMLWYGECIGHQPANATMLVAHVPGRVPGHNDARGFHQIIYHVPAGTQKEGHLRPGHRHSSATRYAYLPNNAEGTRVLRLLQQAFARRLIFTIGDSVTTGRKNVPIWNGIHHKTRKGGGAQNHGYPDPTYLERVSQELSMVGVRSEQLAEY